MKILILSKMLHRFNVIPIKISTLIFVDIDKVSLKFIWKSKVIRIATKILKEKTNMEEFRLPDFMTYCK